MKKFAWVFALLVLMAVPVVAQDAPPSQETPPSQGTSQSTSSSQTTPPEGTEKPEKKKVSTLFSPKYEIAAGFSHRSYYSTGYASIGMNGWFGSFDYDWKSWIGFAGEAQGVYARQTPLQGGPENISLYTIMAGPQIYPFRHHKFTPFGHVLYGEGYYRDAIGPSSPFGSNLYTAFSHAWEVGAGLDIHIKPNWSVRAVQFDYGSTHFVISNGIGGSSGSGSTGQGSYRVSVGLVYSFGKR
jgi:opacity protein-like surface antigen